MDMPTNSSLGLRKARGDMSELPSPIARTGSSLDLKRVNLALQGGGSHGAFTWGVLDRLLEDERIAFEGISAASAGGSTPPRSPVVWPRAGAKEPSARSPNSGAASPISAR